MLIPTHLWLGYSLIGLAVLLLIIPGWPFIQKLYLNLRSKPRDFWLSMLIILTTGKIPHHTHKDISARFKVELRTPDSVHAELEKHIAEEKQKRGGSQN